MEVAQHSKIRTMGVPRDELFILSPSKNILSNVLIFVPFYLVKVLFAQQISHYPSNRSFIFIWFELPANFPQKTSFSNSIAHLLHLDTMLTFALTFCRVFSV